MSFRAPFYGGGGGGGGGGEFRNRPDNLRSTDSFELLLGLGTGRIKLAPGGLKNLFIDGVPVEDSLGKSTFKNFAVSLFDGDPTVLQPIKLNLGTSSGMNAISLALVNANATGPGDWKTGAMLTPGVEFIDLRFVVQQLYSQTKDGIGNATATIEIELRPSGAANWINPLLDVTSSGHRQNGSQVTKSGTVAYVVRSTYDGAGTGFNEPAPGYMKITGKTTSSYVKEVRIAVPNEGAYAGKTWEVRCRLIEKDYVVSGANGENEDRRTIVWESIAGASLAPIGNHEGWRGVSWAQIFGQATDQISGIPEVTGIYDLDLYKVPPSTVWDPVARVYTATAWDGVTNQLAWTSCPAWQIKGLIEDDLSGISALAPGSTINKWDVLEASKWFSTLVPDGRGGQHPRYSGHWFLENGLQVTEFVNYLAGAVGAFCWDEGDGRWRMKVEKPENPAMIFTKETITGEFVYQHTDVDSRFNDITCVYRDRDNRYTESRVRVFNQADIDATGRRHTSLVLIGCDNRQEALRRGYIRLLTSLNEKRIVSFTTNRMGGLLEPFSVIGIADGDLNSNTAIRSTGRIVATNVGRTQITLRDTLRLELGVAYTLHVTVPNPNYNPDITTQPTSADWNKPTIAITRAIANTAAQRGDVTEIYLSSALPADLPVNAAVALEATGLPALPKQYRVLSVAPDDGGELVSITAVEIYTSKWVESDAITEEAINGQLTSRTCPPPLLPTDGMFRVDYYNTAFGSRRVLVVKWDRPNHRLIDGYRLHYRVNGGPWVLGTGALIKDQFFEILDPSPGLYEAKVITVDRRGYESLPLVGEILITEMTPVFGYGADGLLQPVEKQGLIREWGGIVAERPSNQTLADSFGISRAAYDAAFVALETYLLGLTPAWNDTTTTTTITRTTWNTLWTDFYRERQQMLNAVRGIRIKIQWSSDGVGTTTVPASNWHDVYVAGQDFWMRQSNDNGVTWGPALRAIGENGTNAVQPVTGMLTNETHVVATAADGTGAVYTDASGTFRVWEGGVEVTGVADGPVYSLPGGVAGTTSWTKTQNGLTIALDKTLGVYNLGGTAWTTDSESFTLQAVYKGFTVSKVYTITKSKAGGNSISVTLIGDHNVFGYSNLSTPYPQTTTFTAYKQNTTGEVKWKLFKADNTLVSSGTQATVVASGYLSGATNGIVTMTHTQFDQFCRNNGTTGAVIEAYIDEPLAPGGVVKDHESVIQVFDGADGDYTVVYDPMVYATISEFDSQWDISTVHIGKCSIVTTTDTGGKGLQVGDNLGDDYVNLNTNDWLAYAPEDLYEVSFDIDIQAATGGTMSLGVIAYDNAGGSLAQVNVAANALDEAANLGRKTYRGFFRGQAAAGAGYAPTAEAPSTLPLGTVKVRPVLDIHKVTGTGRSIIHAVELKKVSDQTLVPKGEWSAATEYFPSDAVTYQGRFFGAKTRHTNQAPPATATSNIYWFLVADKGANAPTLQLLASHQSFQINAAGAIVARTMSFESRRQNTTDTTVWKLRDSLGTERALGTYLTTTGDTASMTHTQFSDFLTLYGGDFLTVSASLSGNALIEDTRSVVKVNDGTNGLNTATVYLFKRSATNLVDADKPTTVATFTFSSGALTGQNNGWTINIPPGTDPIWVTTATASSRDATDTIPGAEWATPAQLARDGDSGTSASRVQLFKRSAATPVKPANPSTYTFATGILALNVADNSWTQNIPAGNDQLWVTVASAVGIGAPATDDIAATEWTDPVVYVRNGNYTSFIYKRAATQPLTPTDTTGPVPSGVSPNDGWFDAPPAADGSPLWMSRGDMNGSNELQGAWSVPIQIEGAPGLSVREVTVFQRAASAPAVPSGGSYNFSTGALTAPTGWSSTIPTGTSPLYAARGYAQVAGTGGTATPTWQAVGKLAEDGADGVDGAGVDIIFQRSATQPTIPTASVGTPTGWYSDVNSVPAGANPIWASTGTRSNSTAAYTWQTPVKLEGVDGSNGLSVREVTVFQRAASAPAVPSGGSYNFSTGALTAPTGWTTGIPTGTATLYAARGYAQIVGNTGTATPSWQAVGPVASNGIDGVDGDGVDIVFQRAASQPATPTASVGTPTGWYSDVNSVPASANPLWASTGTRVNSTASYTWQTPVRMEGTPGTSGLAISVGPNNHQVLCDSAGTPKAGQFNKTSQITVMSGTTNVSSTATYGAATFSGCAGSVSTGGLITFISISADTAYVTVPVSYGGSTSVSVRVDLIKVKDGAAATAGGTFGIDLSKVAGTLDFAIQVKSGLISFSGTVSGSNGSATVGGSHSFQLVEIINGVAYVRYTIASFSSAANGSNSAAMAAGYTIPTTQVAAGTTETWYLRVNATEAAGTSETYASGSYTQ